MAGNACTHREATAALSDKAEHLTAVSQFCFVCSGPFPKAGDSMVYTTNYLAISGMFEAVQQALMISGSHRAYLQVPDLQRAL